METPTPAVWIFLQGNLHEQGVDNVTGIG